MILLPAIDIRDGKAVRLEQGDFDKETVYDADPLDAARKWVEAGAAQLHVVDLDGARDGEPRNLEHLERITGELEVPVQYGGGLRSIVSVREALAAGAARVVLGTAAYNDLDFLDAALEAWGVRVVVAIDVRGGHVSVSGWTKTTQMLATDVIRRMQGRGVRQFVYTNVDRDGMLERAGPRRGARDLGGDPRAVHLLGRDRVARRPARPEGAAPREPRGRDLRQGAVRAPLHDRGGAGAPEGPRACCSSA